MRMRLRRGQGMVEVLLAMAIFVFSVSTLAVLAIDAANTQRQNIERGKAMQLAMEGVEAARAIRNKAFSNLAAGTRGIAVTADEWRFSGTSDTQDQFTRQLVISAPDTDTRYVTSTVSWPVTGGRTASVSHASILTNWRKQGGGGNPRDSTLTGTGTLKANLDNLSVAACANGMAYVGRRNAPEDEFIIVDATDPANPYSRGSYKIGGSVKGVVVNSACTVAYLAGGNGAEELFVMNVANPDAPTLLGKKDLGGSADGEGLVASGTTLYIARDPSGSNPTLVVVDVSSSTNPVILGSKNLGNGAFDVALASSGAFAYVASQHNSQEFQNVNIAYPTGMTVSGTVNLSGNNDLRGIAASSSGSYAYGGRASGGGNPEFLVFNVTNPTSPSTMGTIRFNANVNAVRVALDFVFAVGASSTAEYAVIDASNPSGPLAASKINLDQTANDVAITDSAAYVAANNGRFYVITF